MSLARWTWVGIHFGLRAGSREISCFRLISHKMHDEGATSTTKIFANVFISFIGAGILGVPFAFKEVGKKY